MLNEGGCELANGIGKFWLSKADYNVTTRYYDINSTSINCLLLGQVDSIVNI